MTDWDGSRWVPDAPPASAPRRRRRFMGVAAEAALVTTLTFGLIVGTALAAPGGNGKGPGKPDGGGSSSLILVMVQDDNADGLPNRGDRVTFEVTTTATDRPWVRLDCYQDGVWVSTASAGFFAAYPWDPNFTLASGGWTGGGADCVATLYMTTSNGKTKTLSILSFPVWP